MVLDRYQYSLDCVFQLFLIFHNCAMISCLSHVSLMLKSFLLQNVRNLKHVGHLIFHFLCILNGPSLIGPIRNPNVEILEHLFKIVCFAIFLLKIEIILILNLNLILTVISFLIIFLKTCQS